MSLRAVLVVVALMLVAGLSAMIALDNHVLLNQRLVLPGGVETQVYRAIAGAFLAGFLLTSLLVVVRSGQIAYGRWKEARTARARAMIERRYSQGLEALLGGASAKAEERLRDVLAKAPDHVETLMTLGEHLRGQGRAREAADLHRRAADLRPGDMRPLFALAADWKTEGSLDHARSALEQIVAANPRASLRARRELRELLIEAGRWEDALKVHESIRAQLTSALEPSENRVGLGIRYEIARAAQGRGELREAEREYRNLLKLDPTFIPACLAQGETLVALGAAEEGARVWRRGYEATQSPMFFARLEEHHLSREEPELIIRLMHSLVASSRSRLVPSYYLAKLYLRLEMIDEAEATLAALQAAGAETRAVRLLSAVVLERRGRLKEAVLTYRRATEEAGLVRPRYVCRSCAASLHEAAVRCPRCGDWSTIDVDMGELLAAEQAGVLPNPEWAAGA